MALMKVYVAGIHYRQEMVKCGKDTCKKCKSGNMHGPYWFAYTRTGAYLKKRYVGTELPAAVRDLGDVRVQGDGYKH